MKVWKACPVVADWLLVVMQKAIESENGKELMENVITVEWAFSK
jgi:hypothetical protein